MNSSQELRVLPDEVHFALLDQMSSPADWKNYSQVYTHLTMDDYFWKKLMVKFPNLTADECQFRFNPLCIFNTKRRNIPRRTCNITFLYLLS